MTDYFQVVYAAPADAPALEFENGHATLRVDRVTSIAACRNRVDRADCVVVGSGFSEWSTVECCRFVREREPDVPLVVYPDEGSEALAGRVVAEGVDGYVPAAERDVLEGRLLALLDGDSRRLADRGDARTTDGDEQTTDDQATDRDEQVVNARTTDGDEQAMDDQASDRDERLGQEGGEYAKPIVDATVDGIYAVDSDGRFTSVTDAFAAMTGHDREALRGAPASTVFPSDAVEQLLAPATESEPGSHAGDVLPGTATTVRTRVLRIETAAADSIPCEVTTILRGDAESTGAVGIVRDVSDRAEMRRELLAHQSKIANLHEVASRLDHCDTRAEIYEETVDAAAGVLQFDLCVVSEVADSMLELQALSSGTDPDRFRKRRSLESGLGAKTYREGVTLRVDDVSASDVANPQDGRFESALSVPIGEYGVFQAISTERAAFDARDEELAELLISHVTDALDRLTYEERLVAERDRFAVLFENVPDAVVTGPHVGSDFVVEDANSAFEETFGYDLETLRGEPIDEYIAAPERREEAREINARSEAGEVVETEVKRRTADGLRDFMLRVVPFEVEGEGEYAFGVYTDVTEQKQRQKRVEVLNRVLRHDLRNGMNVVEGCAEQLAAMADDEAAAEYARVIGERTDELIDLAGKTRIVERTLDRGSVPNGPVDVTEIVETAVGRLTDAYPGVEIERSLPSQAPVRADDLLTEAVYNVLENAVEHSDRSEPTISLSAAPVSTDSETISLSIVDDGPGIPDEERQLLEEEREITQLRHASGLGLWLVDWVVTQSGGELRFGENEPRGTVVELRLPMATIGPDNEPPTVSD